MRYQNGLWRVSCSRSNLNFMPTSLRHFLAVPAVLALAAGITLAQPAPPEGHGPGGHMNMLAQRLNLTADQQAQAKAIFEQTSTAAAPLHDQMKALHADITAAVKANDQAKLAQLATTLGTLTGQSETLRLQAEARFYALLTPAQQAQFDTMTAGRGMGMGPAMMRGHRQ
ncbi:MAG TPA: hypothetical protein DEQ47_01565 [Solibacterales bacterium]|nr:hypothetical protein [Bryobacterales bacterium]